MAGRPQLVLFDLNDVLCRYDRTAFAAALAESTGCSPEAVRRSVWSSGLEARSDNGELGPDAYLQALGELLGRPVPRSDWLDARRRAMTASADVLVLVERLRQRCPVALLTNNSPLIAEHMDLLSPEIARQFEGSLFASGSLGAAKPRAEAFLRCVERLGMRPADVLYVDDLADNAEAARNAGLQACQFLDAPQLAVELARHGLL